MLKDQKTHTMMFKFLARKFEEDTVKLLWNTWHILAERSSLYFVYRGYDHWLMYTPW